MNELEKYIGKDLEIPWEKAASYYLALKNFGLEKTAEDGDQISSYSDIENEPEDFQKPKIIKNGGPTPEEMEQLRAMQMLQQDEQEEALAGLAEADYYRQAAEDLSMQLQEAQAQLEQQSQMAQEGQAMAQEADAQNQDLSMQLEQALQDSMQSREALMQMRQAIQTYRENLQNLALSDPTAMAGPLAMPPMEQDQGELPEEEIPEEEILEEGQKTSAALDPERIIGALAGAAISAGASRATAGKKDKPSALESSLRAKLKSLDEDESKGYIGKTKANLFRYMAEAEKTKREHPGMASAAAAIPGAVVGYKAAPHLKGILQAVARGGK